MTNALDHRIWSFPSDSIMEFGSGMAMLLMPLSFQHVP